MALNKKDAYEKITATVQSKQERIKNTTISPTTLAQIGNLLYPSPTTLYTLERANELILGFYNIKILSQELAKYPDGSLSLSVARRLIDHGYRQEVIDNLKVFNDPESVWGLTAIE